MIINGCSRDAMDTGFGRTCMPVTDQFLQE
jgi:hypothetical protein